MQSAKHEKVELVHVAWLQQQQTAHLLYDGTITKEMAENTARRKWCTEIEHSIQTIWWMDRYRKALWYCWQKWNKWTVLPHKSKYSSSLGGYNSSTADVQVHAKGHLQCQWLWFILETLPDKMHTLNSGIFKSMKVNKEGIFIFVCANVDCSEKFPLLVEGMSEHPQYFSKTKFLQYISTFTIKLYRWPTTFLQFMINLNKRIVFKNTKALSTQHT